MLMYLPTKLQCSSTILKQTPKKPTLIRVNLISEQDNDDYSIIYKFYLYVGDLTEAKYQFILKKCENNGLKNLKGQKSFTEYSNNMQDVYKNIEEYNPNKKCSL